MYNSETKHYVLYKEVGFVNIFTSLHIMACQIQYGIQGGQHSILLQLKTIKLAFQDFSRNEHDFQ